MIEPPQLDELDHQLIAMLNLDARVSNRKIASSLGVTEGTVRGRIKRLQSDGLIAFTAVTGLELARKSRIAFIGIQVKPAKQREVAQRIARIDEVNAVLLSFGEYNISAICLFDELSEIVEIASERILQMDDIESIETSIAVRTVKYNSGMARITSAQLED